LIGWICSRHNDNGNTRGRSTMGISDSDTHDDDGSDEKGPQYSWHVDAMKTGLQDAHWAVVHGRIKSKLELPPKWHRAKRIKSC
jgi:hypothetical protein